MSQSSTQAAVVEPLCDDLALVHACKSGDVAAFEELVKRYDRRLFRIAQHITQNREDAQDAVQGAFLKAFSHLGQFRETSKFSTWLIRIALNEALLKFHRKTARGSAAPLYRRCIHGKPLWCSAIHDTKDNSLGQPLCAQCYDYAGHVLFSWWAPELWRRFTIAVRRGVRAELGRRGEDPDAVAVSFVKVVELQARAIPHYHTVIRLDAPATDSDGTVAPPQMSITAAELAALGQAAAHRVRLEVAAGEGRSRVLRFGEQIDTQPCSGNERRSTRPKPRAVQNHA